MADNASTAQVVNSTVAKNRANVPIALIAVAAVLAAVGIAFWVLQNVNGLGETNMRNYTPWGLGIGCFMLFVGISAGSLIVGVAPSAFGIEGYEGILKPAVWVSLASGIVAACFIVFDLGQPLRVFEMLVSGNIASPLMWDMIALVVYFALEIVLFVALVRGGAAHGTLVRGLSIAAIVAAVALQLVEALIFSAYSSHAYWHTALMGPWFVSSALLSGSALIAAVAYAFRALNIIAIDSKKLSRLVQIIGVFALVDLFMLLADLVTAAYPGGSDSQVVGLLIQGPIAPFFWMQVVCYVAVAVMAFAPSLRAKQPAVMCGAILALVGVLCKRMQLLLGGCQVPNFSEADLLTQYALPNWSNGMLQAYGSLVYLPSASEVIFAIGTIGIGLLVFFVGMRFVDLGNQG